MIKIAPKCTPDENEQKHKWGYDLMQAVFNDLVFSGNLAGFVPAGTESVTIRADANTVRKSIIENWCDKCTEINAQPDDILTIEEVYRWQ